ncbi:helix-turn-helix domain-containing protein [uncultured Legionella sp.]|uniref:helix-turn-helix domain-containing protein n=1 Tax=uncultured Legionella sp. TaxID=210934 RepID=UPI002619BCF4|nr:helix-turn-helix domain-containing protein [uncultured Legionella sp.]
MAFIRSPNELALIVLSQRKKQGLSQLEVGKLVGLTQKTISGFENKPESTQLETLFRILSALNLDVKICSKIGVENEASEWKNEW